MSSKRPASNNNDDDSIIDVTGLFLHLKEAMRKEIADIWTAAPTPPRTSTVHQFYDYEPPSLGKLYKDKLALTPKQISWLNRFPLPANTFLDIEAGRAATVRLYLAVLPLLEQQLKAKGSTLAQTVKTLDSRTKSLRYYASTAWYYTPPKTGADAYLAIFRLCENAARIKLGHKRKVGGLFTGALAELEPVFQEVLGRRVLELLPPLLALVPAPDHATELLLNRQNTSRWKTELEQLLHQLAAKTPALLKALTTLAARNAQNPSLDLLLWETTKRLAATHREAALGYYLRYLHTTQALFRVGKPLPKNLHKQLFPLPEQAERFQVIANELAFYKKLDEALAKVPTVYEVKRRKIELDKTAIHAARDQHAGTVELLNEYLQDTPTPPGKPAKPAKTTAPAKTIKTSQSAKKPSKSPATPTAGSFASGLGLSAPQQALLQLFAAHQLTLSQAKAEAFAKSHGTLRHQLIDGLNDTCYELLDDVLVEETGDGYTIYEPYFQKITG
ncbi:tellurite resistance TerB C-terminal domain-containing protein [Hymenobacter siberiensis]|uniref:tellurite resistance TerB C-terminal domain-containing protein n=1 Tax=Hymenobacter siberiensis TaxID=2848396 RepID=UPI001C1E19E6|nr:tellurite resistance TerB C-terminal domain-containing protein [Hymenobacter siberiensis]